MPSGMIHCLNLVPSYSSAMSALKLRFVNASLKRCRDGERRTEKRRKSVGVNTESEGPEGLNGSVRKLQTEMIREQAKHEACEDVIARLFNAKNNFDRSETNDCPGSRKEAPRFVDVDSESERYEKPSCRFFKRMTNGPRQKNVTLAYGFDVDNITFTLLLRAADGKSITSNYRGNNDCSFLRILSLAASVLPLDPPQVPN